MKKIMFYCQHIVGMGHLVRSIEIIKGLVEDFRVCLINGGETIPNFPIPPEIQIVNIPGIKTDAQFQNLEPINPKLTLTEVKRLRQQELLNTFIRFKPDLLIVELFPFGRRRFSFELIPLLEMAKFSQTKIVCSLRDLVINKGDAIEREEKICNLVERYFDSILIHGDPSFICLEEIFSRTQDLKCSIKYTGYVARTISENNLPEIKQPAIVVSVGGGRFGHDLLECAIATAPLLKEIINHHIYIFTGPFIPEEVYVKLQRLALGQSNISLQKYNPELFGYLKQAELSISMCGYNTSIDILNAGVEAMMMAFENEEDPEQQIRLQRLEKLAIATRIRPEDLVPEKLGKAIVNRLQKKQTKQLFDLNGVANTNLYLKKILKIA
jgi:predicted glycosyltransferase